MFGYKIFAPNFICYGNYYNETINTPYMYTEEHKFNINKINICKDNKKFYICKNPDDCLYLENIISYDENNIFNFIYTKVEIIGNYELNNNFIICSKFKIIEILNFIDFSKLLTFTININNDKIKCSYVKNKLEGEFIDKEKFIICYYKNNEKNGKYIKYYDKSFDKILFECIYINDKLEGILKTYKNV